jgi:hypothetical protein
MYDHHEDDNIHAMIMYNNLNAILNSMDNGNKAFYNKAMMASDYMSMFYDVNSRMKQWNAFLDSMLGVPREFPKEKEPTFVYEIK